MAWSQSLAVAAAAVCRMLAFPSAVLLVHPAAQRPRAAPQTPARHAAAGAQLQLHLAPLAQEGTFPETLAYPSQARPGPARRELVATPCKALAVYLPLTQVALAWKCTMPPAAMAVHAPTLPQTAVLVVAEAEAFMVAPAALLVVPTMGGRAAAAHPGSTQALRC